MIDYIGRKLAQLDEEEADHKRELEELKLQRAAWLAIEGLCSLACKGHDELFEAMAKDLRQIVNKYTKARIKKEA